MTKPTRRGSISQRNKGNKEEKKEKSVKSEKITTKNSGLFRLELKPIQKPVVNFLKENEVSVLIGEAGTAKDFCQLYRAIDGLYHKEFDKLVFIKPMVEVGKSMGFLPGDTNDKLSPYEQSFKANLIKMVNTHALINMKSKIEFRPINFLRGNTWDDSVIILSEAQNCTLHELITVCTRLSDSSKLYINGDPDQSDIRNSGLKDFLQIIKNVEGMEHLELGEEHQMRNPMIVKLNREYRKFLKGKGN